VIRDGLDRLVAKGVRHVLAVPGMLFAAGHAKNDIPSVLNTYGFGRPGLKIEYGRELGIDTRMIRAAGMRIREALELAGDHVPVHETLLVVVGRGASDPDANSNVAKVTRMLWEGFGFGWAETAYSGVTFPLVEPALEKRRGSASVASSCFPTSCSPASWCGASTTPRTRSPRAIRISSSSRRLT
jgi:sirohydrochlorin cobaltochelatase